MDLPNLRVWFIKTVRNFSRVGGLFLFFNLAMLLLYAFSNNF